MRPEFPWPPCIRAVLPNPPPSPHSPTPAEELGLPLRALLSFPAYLTYSLAGRIAPRAAAARALGDRPLPLPKLAMTDEAFARWLGVEAEEWEAWLAAWRQGVDTQRWGVEEQRDRRQISAAWSSAASSSAAAEAG